jgi:hypothetical protein
MVDEVTNRGANHERDERRDGGGGGRERREIARRGRRWPRATREREGTGAADGTGRDEADGDGSGLYFSAKWV